MKVGIIFCTVILLISCNQNISQNANVSPMPIVSPTLTQFEEVEKTKRIEKDKQDLKRWIGEDSKHYNISKLADKNLSKTDLEIRVWRFSAFGDKDLIFVLERTDEHWSAGLIQRTIAKKHILNRVSNPPKKYSKKQLENPKSGWEEFWRKLNDNKILTLPNGSEVGNEVFPDGWAFAVEAKVENNYRVYIYYGHEEFKEIREAQQLTKIINIISEEFNLNDFDQNNFMQP